ncbi:MAG: MBL fold metallo-hydrolase [Hyphomicrobiales bacterium]|nr:MBL fold metallo-hydrolase [Hyphomicrobiales bacterium]
MPNLKIGIIPVTLFEQNCGLVWNDETMKAVIIDPGGDLPRIREAVAKAGVAVEKILITHGHIDHAGGAAELADELGVPVEGPHRADEFLLERLPEAGKSYGMAGARAVKPGRWLEEGDTVTMGGESFDVLHCPGHSPGSVVFVSPKLKLAIVGDVLFKGSVGRSDIAGGNHATLINSIKTKLLPLGDDFAFLCGHGPGGNIGEERRTNPFLR